MGRLTAENASFEATCISYDYVRAVWLFVRLCAACGYDVSGPGDGKSAKYLRGGLAPSFRRFAEAPTTYGIATAHGGQKDERREQDLTAAWGTVGSTCQNPAAKVLYQDKLRGRETVEIRHSAGTGISAYIFHVDDIPDVKLGDLFIERKGIKRIAGGAGESA